MPFRTYRALTALLTGNDWHPRGPQRTLPVRLVLEPEARAQPCTKPPVRIFIGTEAAQFRAERTLLWSIRRVRDPGRTYEIYLMKDLAGFNRMQWLTGFTNYRYAIPEFAGFSGRAIYNDADQIYLDDPAKLFDTDMQGHGVLSINRRDTSVALIDCERMASVWNLKAAQTPRRRRHEARMREAGLWGPLDEAWNVHGQDYIPGQASLVHYTTIHAQPWRPTPGDYAYLPNPADDIWLALEREADDAGFHPFDAARPSPEFPAEYSDPDSAGGLERIPDWDIPWLLDRLFQEARDTVAVTVDATVRPRPTPADPLWWYAQMTAAGRRRPRARWRLAVRCRGKAGTPRVRHWSGGPLPADPPRTWVLLDRHPVRGRQALALAEALDWPAETREIRYHPLRDGVAALRSAITRRPAPLPGGVAPPWPDVVIAAGRAPARLARRIARRSEGATRLILLGRDTGPVGESQDVAVACRHYRLWPDPRRIDTVLPPAEPHRPVGHGPDPFQGRPRPYVALLVGKTRERCRLDAYTAFEMAARVRRRVKEAGGTLAVVTGHRAGRRVTGMLRAGAGPDAILETRPAHAGDACLDQADYVIVTGESEALITAAVAAGKPLYLYPLPPRWPGLLPAIADAVYRRALRDVINERGSRRPQRGLQYLCARLIQQLWLLPSCDVEILHRGLMDLGLARRFGEPLGDWRPQPWDETRETARRIRTLLGAAAPPEQGRDGKGETKPTAGPRVPAVMHRVAAGSVSGAVSGKGLESG